jgi:hypothetical protein
VGLYHYKKHVGGEMNYWAVTRLDHITRIWKSNDPFPKDLWTFNVYSNKMTKEYKLPCLEGKEWKRKSPTMSDCLLYEGDFPGVCKYLKDNGLILYLETLINSLC